MRPHTLKIRSITSATCALESGLCHPRMCQQAGWFLSFNGFKEHLYGTYSLCKGQIMSKCIYEIINFPKYHRKDLIDFCPESLSRLDYMLCTHLRRVPLRIIKSSHMYLVYKTFQGKNISNFLVVFL